ncbi:MAG TPA: VCBS repeat-containing protein [Thermoleophilaceae bacterium]|jgi:hypothetical protein
MRVKFVNKFSGLCRFSVQWNGGQTDKTRLLRAFNAGQQHEVGIPPDTEEIDLSSYGIPTGQSCWARAYAVTVHDSGSNFNYDPRSTQTPCYTLSDSYVPEQPQFELTNWNPAEALAAIVLDVVSRPHGSNYQQFLLQTGTPISEQDAAANFDFACGDFNGDGRPDLLCLKKTSTGTGALEVHVLSGASNYQQFLLQTGTPISEQDAAANFDFACGDFNGDGRPDLLCLKKTSTGTGTLEVHVLA